jgi:mono/diheme cytochrome c family protein
MTTRRVNGLLAGLATGTVVLMAMIGGTAAQQAGVPKIKQTQFNAIVSVEGRDNFLAYCAVCHGIDGKGGGPAVPALKVPVPDLTTMAKRYGKYDEVAVQNHIRGASKVPAAHGSTEMPIWGPLFRSQGGDETAFLRVRNLTTYLGSVQVK